MKLNKLIAVFLIVCVIGVAGCSSQNDASQKSNEVESLTVHDIDAPTSDNAEASDNSASSSSKKEAAKNEALISDFKAISQYPELPNGCEVTTLAAVLNYEGVKVSKTVLADDFLRKAPVGQANFYREFVGNPRESDAYGCYAPVLVATAKSYLSSIDSSLKVKDLTGASFKSLYKYIDQNIPVIVWATQYNKTGHYSVTWHVDGQELTWFTPEHCMALVGYDLDSDRVYVADPMQGKVVDFNLKTFIKKL